MNTNKIIIQDIDNDIREILRLVLEDNNYQVLVLSNCRDIKDHIQSFNPQVILLDFRITGQDCITALKEIKASFPQLPVIAMSCSVKIIETYKQIGFDNYMLKPFDIDELYKTLDQYFAGPTL